MSDPLAKSSNPPPLFSTPSPTNPAQTTPAETPSAKRIRQLADLRYAITEIVKGDAMSAHEAHEAKRIFDGHVQVLGRIIDELKTAPKRSTLVTELSTVEGSILSVIENPIGGSKISELDARLLREALETLQLVIGCLRGDRVESNDALSNQSRMCQPNLIDRAIEQLSRSGRGQQAMRDAYALLDNGGTGLDASNQAALFNLFRIAFERPGSTAIIRDALGEGGSHE